MLMGMATPANNHTIVNANDYGPRAILATTRLSSFEVKLSTTVLKKKNVFVGACFQMFILELSQACSLLQKFTDSFQLSSRFVARFSFSRLGKIVLEEGNVTKYSPSHLSQVPMSVGQIVIHTLAYEYNEICNQLDNDMYMDIERLILKYIKCQLFYYVKRKFYLQM